MRRMAGWVLFTLLLIMVLPVTGSMAAQKTATREYFEHLDKESRLEDIVEEIGGYGIKGSGILYFVWKLEDGSTASVVFDSQGRIVMIYIADENKTERIYKREYPEAGPEVPDPIDMGKAIREMEHAIGEQIPASGRMHFPNPLEPGIELSDVTGDGCEDLCTCVTWGSGMVRTDLVVYDPMEKVLYVLDGYNYDYTIDRVEEDRIVIVEEGPHGYNDPIVKTFGTVRIEDGRIVFVPDAEGR